MRLFVSREISSPSIKEALQEWVDANKANTNDWAKLFNPKGYQQRLDRIADAKLNLHNIITRLYPLSKNNWYITTVNINFGEKVWSLYLGEDR